MECRSRARAAFIRKENSNIIEHVTAQIWIPFNSQRQPEVDSLAYKRRTSSISTGLAPSICSVSSGGSSGSEDTIAVRLDNSSTTTSTNYGIMRRLPSPPLLVLFTRPSNSKSRSIVTVTLHGDTEISPDMCQCLENPDCRISSLERNRGSLLDAHKLGSTSRWNLLLLPRKMPEWDELLRLSIIFPTLRARHRMMGCPCNCRLRTEMNVDECIKKKHQGLLGIAKVMYRRAMEEWRQHQDGREDLRR